MISWSIALKKISKRAIFLIGQAYLTKKIIKKYIKYKKIPKINFIRSKFFRSMKVSFIYYYYLN